MRVTPELHFQGSRQDLLDHRECEHVVREPQVRIIRPHDRRHVQPARPDHELERTRAWNLLPRSREILGIEQLDHSPS